MFVYPTFSILTAFYNYCEIMICSVLKPKLPVDSQILYVCITV